MEEKRIKRNIWIVVGITLVLLIGMVMAWRQFLITPQKVAIDAAEAKYKAGKETADKLPAALISRVKAEDNKRYLDDQLAFLRGRYRRLNFNGIRVGGEVGVAAQQVAWRRWLNEYFEGYGIALRDELVKAADASGVTLNTNIKVTPPPKSPEEALASIPAYGLMKPTGGPLKLTVTGALSNILQFFNRINQSSILMVVDRDIKLDGISPEIKATFSLTPYLVATGDGVKLGGAGDAAAGGAPAADASALGGTTGGVPGGLPGGAPAGGAPAGGAPAGGAPAGGAPAMPPAGAPAAP